MNKKENNISLLNLDLSSPVSKAAENLTNKPTQAIGQTFSDLWQLVIGNPVSLAVEKQKLKYKDKLQKYRKSLETKIDSIPQEKQTEPEIQVVAQALDDSKYCLESEELREMFSSLIANSMNIDFASIIHPSFSKIIQQMSPLDAQMLKIFQEARPRGGIAIVDYTKKNESGYTPLIECVPEQMPDNCSQIAAAHSLASLQRLGLIKIHTTSRFSNNDRYTVFETSPFYFQLLHEAKKLGFEIGIKKHYSKLTALGDDFVKVCLD